MPYHTIPFTILYHSTGLYHTIPCHTCNVVRRTAQPVVGAQKVKNTLYDRSSAELQLATLRGQTYITTDCASVEEGMVRFLPQVFGQSDINDNQALKNIQGMLLHNYICVYHFHQIL